MPWDLQLLEQRINADVVSFMEALMMQAFHQSTQHQTVTTVGAKAVIQTFFKYFNVGGARRRKKRRRKRRRVGEHNYEVLVVVVMLLVVVVVAVVVLTALI